MPYRYTICHIDNPEIENPEQLLSKAQVLGIATHYPWAEQLNRMSEMDSNDICYSPSLDFISVETTRSLCLTAHEEGDDLMFSLWHNRPVKTKVLFGLFGEKITMSVVDKWSFNLTDSIEALKLFLDEKYDEVEELMTT